MAAVVARATAAATGNALQDACDYDLTCPICLEDLPKDDMKFDRLWCCGKGMHRECTLQVLETNLNKSGGDNFGKCCLCRADVLEPTDGPRLLARLRVWVDKGKAWAEHNMGKIYEDGYPSMGVERSLPDAKAMYERAIKKGHAGSAANLGNLKR